LFTASITAGKLGSAGKYRASLMASVKTFQISGGTSGDW
jgi:hypothetical protein